MYTKTIWADRNVQYPNRYTDELSNVKTFTPSPGTVTAAGTTVTAARMINIENGVYKLDLLYSNAIQGTTQTPTFTYGKITQIVHKDGSNNTVRTDTFSYASTLITETRTLSTSETVTLKYYFDNDGSYNRTEVV